MEGGAYVKSIDAVREFRAAMQTFAHEAGEALGTHDLELRRALDWLLDDQPKFWQQEIRRAEDAVTLARIELERRLNSRLPGGETPSCMEERKALERARARRDRAEEKAAAMRKWGTVATREADEYTGAARHVNDMLDADVPKALAALDRILGTLESYVALGAGPGVIAPLSHGGQAPADEGTGPPDTGTEAADSTANGAALRRNSNIQPT